MRRGAILILAFFAILLFASLLAAVVSAGPIALPQAERPAGIEIPRMAKKYRRTLIREARARFGLGAPVATMAAQIHQESLWRPDAVSRVGAAGMTQFMPGTASWITEIFPELGRAEPLNPQWAIRAMVRYNRWLYERLTGFDDCERWAFVLASYNGGLGWTMRRKARSPFPEICLGMTCDINPGITPANQKQNADYARRILMRLELDYLADPGWRPGVCWRSP